MKKTFCIFTNPDFDRKTLCGVSKLYQIFYRKYNYNIEFINDEFLKNHSPKENEQSILIIAGGDGTIHRAINLIPSDYLENYTFGIIPSGTANEFAKSLRLPLVLEAAAELIATSENFICRKLGLINGEYRFLTGFLYGIASDVLINTSPAAKYYFGEYAYQLPGLFSLVNYVDFVKKFKLNSKEFYTGYLLINTASLISKNIYPEYLTQEDENLFSIVYLASNLSVADSLRLFVKNQAGGNILQDNGVIYKQKEHFTLEFEGMLDFMLDGEPYQMLSPLVFEHSEQNIKIIA